MIKLTVLYGQPADPDAFERYYLNIQTPLAKRVKGVRRFEIARVVAAPDGGTPKYFRTADLYFDDLASLQKALASPEGQAAAADIPNFATGGVTMLVCDAQDVTSS